MKAAIIQSGKWLLLIPVVAFLVFIVNLNLITRIEQRVSQEDVISFFQDKIIGLFTEKTGSNANTEAEPIIESFQEEKPAAGLCAQITTTPDDGTLVAREGSTSGMTFGLWQWKGLQIKAEWPCMNDLLPGPSCGQLAHEINFPTPFRDHF